jgi:hypothetical protein
MQNLTSPDDIHKSTKLNAKINIKVFVSGARAHTHTNSITEMRNFPFRGFAGNFSLMLKASKH